MKKMTMAFAVVMMALGASAQTTSVNDIPLGGSDTTISISKGSHRERDFDIISASAEISGDPNPLRNAARESWKKACADWKAELRDLNKENQVLAMNCGTANCKKEDHGTVCASNATYQLKVRIRK